MIVCERVLEVGQFEVRPALCLDFDGTIRYSKQGKFINKPEDVALFEGAEEKIWEYRDKGYIICGVTNQGGVAFGFKTVEGNEAEVEQTLALFERNPFHLVEVSYGHAGGRKFPYNQRSLLRKPDMGMLVMCEVEALELGIVIDWDESLMVGDREDDEGCAEKAGVAFEWADKFFGRE